MNTKQSELFNALEFLRQLMDGDLRAGNTGGAQPLSPDDYFTALKRTMEQEKFEFAGKSRVPITYTIQIPAADLQLLENRGLMRELPPVLTQKLVEYAQAKSYVAANGKISVAIELGSDDETRVVPTFLPRNAVPQQSAGKQPVDMQPSPHDTVLFKAPVAELEISTVSAPTAVKTIPLSIFPVTIGREAPDNSADIQFAAPSEVSRRHLRIQREAGGGFTIVRFGQNETTINGKVLPLDVPVPLVSDSELLLANQIRIRFSEMHGTRRISGK